MTSKLERYQGALLGLAVGDAIGTTVEFKQRGSFKPVTDMTGGGVFKLKAGEWTDDTSMALCLAESLISCDGFNPTNQMETYVAWWRHGHNSSNGRCFDIGGTTRTSLARFQANGEVYCEPDEHTSGNGALMRLAPIPMFFRDNKEAVWLYAGESTRTTHGSTEAIECSQLFAMMLRTALMGDTKIAILNTPPLVPLSPKVAAISEGTYKRKSLKKIKGSGYCVHSLEAALYCFAKTSTFDEAVLMAANLGDDADTTAAITGQIAGAFYGVKNIKAKWRSKVVMKNDILDMAGALII
jgi:ADP-ribosyl-[dinitrogen reductase] hydrolase